ncbi:hypothetical protein ACFX10_021669 [Malus domestica]
MGRMGSNLRLHSANPNDYKLLEEVGYGASATVYRAIYLPFNEVVAVKCLDLDRCNSNFEDIRREAQTMRLIDHPNVVRAFCSFVVERNLWRLIVTENPINTAHYKHSRNAKPTTKVAVTHKVFDKMPHSDTFAWNRLIQTHIANADFHHALATYHQMLIRGVRPDRHTLPRVLSASRLSADLSLGKQLHAHAHKLGCSGDRYVVAALIELYGRLDSADSAKGLFDKSLVTVSVSWTMLARLYIAEGKPGKAVHVFERMVESGAQIDSVAVATAAGACGMLRSLIDGTKVHRVAKERGLEYDVLMVGDGVKPDPLSVSSVLPACARMSAGKHGKETHGFLLRHGIRMNLTVLNALMDMYVKSGFIKSAAKVFARSKYRDLVSWTVMITGYSLHGQGKIGVDLFCQMEKETSTQIDEITYAAVLHACVAARMVEEGKFYFNCIKTPTVAHCALFVTLLSRSGLFYEAKNFITDKKDRSGSRHA